MSTVGAKRKVVRSSWGYVVTLHAESKVNQTLLFCVQADAEEIYSIVSVWLCSTTYFTVLSTVEGK